MSEQTDQILAMSKAQSIAEKTIALLTRDKVVLQESVNTLEQQLSEKTVALNVSETTHQTSLNHVHEYAEGLGIQVSSLMDSLELLQLSNTQLTKQVDELSAQIVKLEASNSKLYEEKQQVLTRFHQLEEKKQGDLKIRKLKMNILQEIKERRLGR